MSHYLNEDFLNVTTPIILQHKVPTYGPDKQPFAEIFSSLSRKFDKQLLLFRILAAYRQFGDVSIFLLEGNQYFSIFCCDDQTFEIPYIFWSNAIVV